jgi:hypothetical protein
MPSLWLEIAPFREKGHDLVSIIRLPYRWARGAAGKESVTLTRVNLGVVVN